MQNLKPLFIKQKYVASCSEKLRRVSTRRGYRRTYFRTYCAESGSSDRTFQRCGKSTPCRELELQDRFVKSVKPDPERQIDHFDTVVKGLALTVSPGGTKTWSLLYTKPTTGKRARMKDRALSGDQPRQSAREGARDARGHWRGAKTPLPEKKGRGSLAGRL